MTPPFEALDFVYMPSRDVAADVRHFTEALGGELVFAIEAFGTRVAMVQLTPAPPAVLLAGHRDGGPPEGAPLDAEVRELVDREAAALPEDERAALAVRVIRLATGLGPLEPLLGDSSVDEVMVNGPGEVWVERRGELEATGVSFGSESELRHAIERILAPLGRRVDEASPLCDARLPDGSRVNVVIPPLALSGPCVTIRKFRTHGFSLDDLVAGGTLPQGLADFLAGCVAGRAAILVSGGTGSGKTTTLGALSGAIPDGERIVTIEDAAELRLRQRHVVRLESRPAYVPGAPSGGLRAAAGWPGGPRT